MIDKEWVEENIGDEEVKEFLFDTYVYEGEDGVHEDVEALISNILETENNSMFEGDYAMDDFEDVDSNIQTLQTLSKTLKILDTFVD